MVPDTGEVLLIGSIYHHSHPGTYFIDPILIFAVTDASR
jgi:hypothetical protein